MRHVAVMIVDNHAGVRQCLRAFLSTCPDLRVVGEAADGNEAIRRCAETQPDVIVMDMVLPAMDGPAVTTRLKDLNPRCQVVALTSAAEPEMVERALGAGAIGYVLKDSPPDRIVDAIPKAYRGRAVVDTRAPHRTRHDPRTARWVST